MVIKSLSPAKNRLTVLLLILIVVIGIGVRLVPLLMYSSADDPRQAILYSGDAFGYHKLAMIFWQKGITGFLDPANDIDIDPSWPSLSAFRTPLYPYFISRIYSIYGVAPLITRAAQIGIDALTTILIFIIAQTLFKRKKVSLIAAFLYALSPLAIMYSVSLHAENFFTFSFTLVIAVFIWALKKKRWWNYVLLGIVIGLSVLVKPVLMYFYPVFVLCIFLNYGSLRKTWKKSLMASGLILIFFILVITPWQVRNLIVFHHYSLTYQPGRELLVWRASTCLAWTEHLSVPKMWGTIQQPYLTIKDPFVRSQIEGRDGVRFIENNPVAFANCTLRGLKNFFYTPAIFVINYPGTHPYEYGATTMTNLAIRKLNFSRTTWLTLSHIYSIVLGIEYLLMLIGLFLLFRKKEYRIVALFFSITIMYFVVITGVDSYSRYRYPLNPIFAILTAGSFFLIVDAIKKFAKNYW